MYSVNINFYDTELFLDGDRLTFEQQDECLFEAVANALFSWPALAFLADIDERRFTAMMARETRPTDDEFVRLSDVLEVDLTREQRWGYRSVEDIIGERRKRKYSLDEELIA